MSTIIVDGEEKRDIGISQSLNLNQAVQVLYQTINTKTSLITSVKVDGVELNAANEEHLGTVPVGAVGQIEVTTSHPREIAEEMLQNIRDFVVVLQEKCIGLAQVEPKDQFEVGFSTILEGLNTVAESIRMVKRALDIKGIEEVDKLENEFLLIIKALLEAKQKDDDGKTRIVLAHKMAPCLEQWATIGVPAMIRSRDS